MKSQYTKGVVERKFRMLAEAMGLPIAENNWEEGQNGLFLEVDRRKYKVGLVKNGSFDSFNGGRLSAEEIWHAMDMAIRVIEAKKGKE